MRSSGKLEWIIAGTAEGPRTRGNPRNRTPAQQNGIGVRGNPEPKPRLGGKIENAANPQLDQQADGTMNGPMSYGITQRAPEAARSLAFSICAEIRLIPRVDRYDAGLQIHV
jgi:hypothetical protein